jgi:hypothetical protein
MDFHVEPSAYRAAAVAMRLLLDGDDPFPILGSQNLQGKPTLRFPRSRAIDETVMSWKTSPLNAYAALASSMAACLRGDDSRLRRFVSDKELVDKLSQLDAALRDSKLEVG